MEDNTALVIVITAFLVCVLVGSICCLQVGHESQMKALDHPVAKCMYMCGSDEVGFDMNNCVGKCIESFDETFKGCL